MSLDANQNPGSQNPGSQNTEYLARIDDAIAQSAPLQAWLVERSSQDSRIPSKRTKLLLRSLQEPIQAQLWVSDPSLAPFLPIILRGADKPEDLSILEPWYRLLLKQPLGILDLLRRFYYPLALGAAAIVLMYYISVAIIPAFQAMFVDFQLRLPPLTKLVFSIANFVANQTLFAIAQILIGIGLLIGMIKLIGYLLDRLEGIKLIGFLRRGNKKSLGSMASWSGTLSELLAVGMPVDLAITTAGLASQRPWLKVQSERLVEAFNSNPDHPLSRQPGANNFSSSSIAALDLHRQGAPGASILREIAQSYATRWSSRPSFSYTWLGPLLLVFVAKMFFFLVLALFGPLISLLTALSG